MKGCKIYEFINPISDEGGIFKAKQNNNVTAGAEEIEESKDTKVDLPIDQVEAEEVVG